MSPRPLTRPGFAIAAALLLIAGPVAAQAERWPGEIRLTTTVTTSEHGTVESWTVEERWSDLRVVGGEAGGTYASFAATWSVRETRSSADADCSASGSAEGSGTYPWLFFEEDPFDDLGYLIASGGYGGGPEVTGVMTIRCANRDPFEVEYVVAASWLPAIPFVPPASMIEVPEDVWESMPRETRELLREVEALLLEGPGGDGFAVRGRANPLSPSRLQGSAVRDLDGGTVVLTWDLERPIACYHVDLDEELWSESEALRRAKTAASDAAWGAADGPVSGSPLTTADAVNGLTDAVGGDAVALQPAVGGGATGIQSFVIRLSAAGQVLPTLDVLRRRIDTTCVEEGSLEAAERLLVGSIQWQGNRYRITARIIDVETAVVLDTVMLDGTGGAEALPAAVARALSRFLLRS
jgi:hypothetical protein